MTKYFILGINSILVVLFNLFSGDDISVKHNFPNGIAAGGQFDVEISISKGSVNNFGKLQIDFPEGITAEEIDSKGAKFTFENKQLKLLWIQLPSESDFSIKIKIKAAPTITEGNKTITGKFLYVVGNDKKQIDIEPHQISVSNSNQTPIATTTTTTTDTSTATFKKPEEPTTGVSVVRKITKDEKSGNYRVDIKIKKGEIKGFAKFSDVLPDGVVATKGEATGGGNFKYAEKKATIIWATLPKEEELTASYTIKVTREFKENPLVTGSFSYLENDETMKTNATDEVVPINPIETITTNTVIPTETITPTNTVVANTNTVTPTETVIPTNTVVANTNTVTPTETVTPTNTVVANTNTVTPTNTVVTEVVASTNNTTTNNVVSANVNFQVQIGAYNNPPSVDFYTSKYNISEKISTDMHNGLTKFLVGKFADYKESRDFREKIKNKGVNGAFVTAYNSGKRVTVQEALMVVQQKWFR